MFKTVDMKKCTETFKRLKGSVPTLHLTSLKELKWKTVYKRFKKLLAQKAITRNDKDHSELNDGRSLRLEKILKKTALS